MKLTVKHPYLVFPVNMAKERKKLLFYNGGSLVYDLDVRLCRGEPDFYAYIDVRRFIGQEIEVTAEPDEPLPLCEADMVEEAHDSRRPLIHFTAPRGWLNDPNGLVCGADGTYHLFYQYNPAEPEWGNMHWGHAVSRDLIHWKHQPIALFPDEKGVTYSGSGILDKDGLAGFGKNALLFYYTAAGNESRLSAGQPYTQRLAYSTDNGKTFTKYAGDPVIRHIDGANRDPKIVFCDELGRYIIALYLIGSKYALFASDDLIRFEKIQELELPSDSECPDFYPVTADDGTRHWIFSGAHGRYIVGNMADGMFTPEQDVRSLYGDTRGYAAQTFSDMPDGRRVCIEWDRIDHASGAPFASQMSLPYVITLKKKPDGYIIYPEPVKETALLRQYELHFVHRAEGYRSAASAAFELTADMPEGGGEVTLSFYGNTLIFDRAGGELRCGDMAVPLEKENGRIFVRIYYDVCSVEVFSGARKACFNAAADESREEIVLTGEMNAELKGWDLSAR